MRRGGGVGSVRIEGGGWVYGGVEVGVGPEDEG
jgi:hypothetical protein